uniref:CCHC-type domain-containing protein n=1 Tax=Phytophthora ramorum TaxID=164328 RepID=H3H3G5_PHYRM
MLSMSTADHPQTDGQTERVNRVLVDTMKSYAHSFLLEGAACACLVAQLPCPSTDTKFKVEPFDGSNYSLWSYKMKMYLMSKGLWEAVCGEAGSTAKEQQAHAAIVLNLNDSQLMHVVTSTTAKEAWDTLKKFHKTQDMANRLWLKEKFSAFKFTASSVGKHVTELEKLVMEMKNAGCEPTEEDVCATMLRSLPSSYEALVQAFRMSVSEFKLADLVSKLIAEEVRQKDSNRIEEATALLAGKGSGKQQQKKKNPRGMRKKGPFGKCFNCGKPGHYARDCRSEANGFDAGDVQLPVPPKMRFGDNLIEAIDGLSNIAAGTVPDDYLKEMGINGWSDLQTHGPYDYLMEPYEPRPPNAMATDYPNLYTGESGPTARALEAAASLSGAFFYFMQPELWEDIAEETNNYFEEKLEERVQVQYSRQVAREKKHPEFKRQTTERIHTELLKMKAVTPRDLCVFVGLLIARSIAPNKEKLAHHWKTTNEGAIPRGYFGQVMVRDRFMHISRNLHFSCNDDERAAKDRAWKLRPVIDALKDRFAAGFMPPATMAFDEAMLPSRSTFNKMRVYLKDKPHKWGTKLFMLCCSTTAYCIRFEVYCGKKERGGQGRSTDFKSGLSIQLIPKKKKGEKQKPPKIPKNRPASIERGTFIVADALQIPGMRLLRWWDTRAVHMLSTGGSVETNRIVRREKRTGEQTEVACPRIVKDYQTFMGGVDVHDQLRLQRVYSARAPEDSADQEA